MGSCCGLLVVAVLCVRVCVFVCVCVYCVCVLSGMWRDWASDRHREPSMTIFTVLLSSVKVIMASLKE